MKTRLHLTPLSCPRCGRGMSAMANAGALWLRCAADAPRCGIVWPGETALAAHVEERSEAPGIQGGRFVRVVPPVYPVPVEEARK